MRKQSVAMTIVTKNGAVTNIGKSVINIPKIQFAGGTINWHEEQYKERVRKG